MKVLYVCTHNRCRSILSEAITNNLADGIVEAKSAGSQPAGEVHPLSLKYLESAGYPTLGLQSQSWDDFEAFKPDVVITVCDSAAGETCPVYFGRSIKVHWGLSDPSKMSGPEEAQEEAFLACIDEIANRAKQLRKIAEQELTADNLRLALSKVGAMS